MYVKYYTYVIHILSLSKFDKKYLMGKIRFFIIFNIFLGQALARWNLWQQWKGNVQNHEPKNYTFETHRKISDYSPIKWL